MPIAYQLLETWQLKLLSGSDRLGDLSERRDPASKAPRRWLAKPNDPWGIALFSQGRAERINGTKIWLSNPLDPHKWIWRFQVGVPNLAAPATPQLASCAAAGSAPDPGRAEIFLSQGAFAGAPLAAGPRSWVWSV